MKDGTWESLKAKRASVHAWERYTRGEDLALVALRFLADWTTREIGTAIGRTQHSVSERMTKLGMRLPGGREWAWAFLTNGHRR